MQQNHGLSNIKYEDLLKTSQQTNNNLQNHNVMQNSHSLHAPLNIAPTHFGSTHTHFNQVNINGHSYINGGYHHQQQPNSYQAFHNLNGQYGGQNYQNSGIQQGNNHYNQYHNNGINVGSSGFNHSVGYNTFTGNYNQVAINSYKPQIPAIENNWTL
jgi:hypothetical protein